jgi:hypothetical protein
VAKDQGQIRFADGTLDFSGGVDSFRVPTVASESNPNGLPRNCVPWLDNATVRGGGILQRTGWQRVCKVADSTHVYQGGIMYEMTNGFSYLMLWLSGHCLQVRVDADNSVNDVGGPANFPTDLETFHCVQGEEFVVTQVGDNVTLPAIWDGVVMRQSVGLQGQDAQGNPELPAAGPMCYYQGRLWYAIARTYTAGDIINGAAGTTYYGKRDSILKVTENPLAIGGDGFSVPTQAGNIRALDYAANLDSALGEGTLYAFTRKQVYGIDVPITRADWISTDSNNAPVQRCVQRGNGAVSDRSVVAVNGDLFYQSLEPSIRSLMVAIRNFGEWGNVPVSRAITRALGFNNRGLMHFSGGIAFDNRLWQAILPVQTPQGVIHQAIAMMDFSPVSSLTDSGQPVWEGVYEGVDVMQMFVGDFGGLERAFAVVRSRVDQGIEVWEMTTDSRTENGDNRVNWYVELPCYTWGREYDLKQLDGGELWIDKVYGTVDINFYYRSDGNPCWQYWHTERICSARNSAEDINNPVTYPLTQYGESGKFPIMLPAPPTPPCDGINARPMNIGHQFQVKVTVKGWCRIRGFVAYALPKVKEPFGGLVSLQSPIAPVTPWHPDVPVGSPDMTG